jgi:exodeoxyribonuclease VII small subunit
VSKDSKKITAKSYRQLSSQLAELLAWFESEDLDIDQASAKYEEALQLISVMEKHLKTAQNKVKKLTVE